MPTELKIIVIFNVIATVILALATLGFGGGIVAGVFPPAESVEMKLVLIEPNDQEAPGAAGPAVRLEIPPEYRTPDLSPSPWKFTPDGSVQFADSGR